MKTLDNLKNNDIALKYLNIMLILAIILLIYSIIPKFIEFDSAFYLDLALACIGGIIAGFIGRGIIGILGGAFVGALSLCIGLNVFMILWTLIIDPNPAVVVLIVVLVPLTLIFGGISGLIGGFIGISIKTVTNYIKK